MNPKTPGQPSVRTTNRMLRAKVSDQAAEIDRLTARGKELTEALRRQEEINYDHTATIAKLRAWIAANEDMQAHTKNQARQKWMADFVALIIVAALGVFVGYATGSVEQPAAPEIINGGVEG